MRRQLRWYGASPLHLLAMLACFGLAGYAAARLIPSAPIGIAVWFLGAVIGHDVVLMPLYTLADRSAMLAIRHREPQLPVGPWINYLRVPAAISGILLLVWFPLILRLSPNYPASTTLSADPYVWHWLAVTGALFLLSAVALAFQLRRSSRSVPAPAGLVAPAGPVVAPAGPVVAPAGLMVAPERPAAAADGTEPDRRGKAEAAAEAEAPVEAEAESGPGTDSGQVAGEPDLEPEAPPGSQEAGEPAPAVAADHAEERESRPGSQPSAVKDLDAGSG